METRFIGESFGCVMGECDLEAHTVGVFFVCFFSSEYKKARAEGWGCHAITMMNTKADEAQT
jgi:hypothetical protein